MVSREPSRFGTNHDLRPDCTRGIDAPEALGYRAARPASVCPRTADTVQQHSTGCHTSSPAFQRPSFRTNLSWTQPSDPPSRLHRIPGTWCSQLSGTKSGAPARDALQIRSPAARGGFLARIGGLGVSSVNHGTRGLVGRLDDDLVDIDMLRSRGYEHDALGHIISSQRLHASIDALGATGVA